MAPASRFFPCSFRRAIHICALGLMFGAVLAESAWATSDTTPNAFTFSDKANVGLNAVITSNPLRLSGINTAAPISVTGGEYSLGCKGNFASTAGAIRPRQLVCVRHTSSGSTGTTVDTTLTIGGVSDTFSSTTVATADALPTTFAFTDKTNVGLNTAIVSNTLTVSGINTGASIGVAGGEYSVGCNGSFTDLAGTILPAQSVCIRHISSGSPATTVDTTLTIGGVSDTFSSTTVATPDTTPASFGFRDKTNVELNLVLTSGSARISGTNTGAPISVSGGRYSIGCNGSFTDLAGTILPTQSVCLRHTSSGSPGTTVDTTLTIGGVSDTFSSTTVAAPSVTISVSPAAVDPDEEATLTWSSTGATSCAASDAWSGSRATSGQEQVSEFLDGNYTYTLTCTGPGGVDAASAVLTVGSPPTPPWDISVVDTRGAYTSIALAPDGSPRIVYLDWLNDLYRYASWDGSQWALSTIDSSQGPFSPAGEWSSLAVDSNGRSHVSFHVADVAYRYGWLDAGGSAWTFTDVPVPAPEKAWAYLGHNEIAVNPTNNTANLAVHLTDGSGADACDYLGYWRPSMATTERVDCLPSASDGTFSKSGIDAAIAVDSAGGIHISHTTWNGQPLDTREIYVAYAYNDGSGWVKQNIELGAHGGGGFANPKHTSIAVDANNRPHVFYFISTFSQYRYAYHDGSSWIIEDLGVGSPGAGSSAQDIAVDGNGVPHVCFYGDSDDLSYARRLGPNNWAVETVESFGDFGDGCSIAIDGSGKVHISYEGDNGELKYATR